MQYLLASQGGDRGFPKKKKFRCRYEWSSSRIFFATKSMSLERSGDLNGSRTVVADTPSSYNHSLKEKTKIVP